MATTPMSVLRFDSDKRSYEFVEGIFDKIIGREDIQNLPIAVVSIVGDYRKGKSTLLNFLLRYFQNYDSEDWLGNFKEPLKGFSWKQGVKRDTIGIVLWPEPLIITKKDGSKIAVLLMDTQGLFDDQTSHKDCSNIFIISSLLSSIQVYNQMHMIQSNDITKLSEFSQYSKRKQKDTGYKGFQDLLLLVRDWSCSNDYPYGAEGGRDYLKSMKMGQSNTFKEEWKILYQTYTDIDCFLMPHPGLAVNVPGFACEVAKLRPTFVSNLRQLVKSHFSPEKIAIKTNRGQIMKIAEFSIFFKTIVKNLKYDNTILIDDLSCIDAETQAKTAANYALGKFLTHYTALNPTNDPEKLDLSVEQARYSALLIYFNMTKKVDSEIKESILDDLKVSLDEFVTEHLTAPNHELVKSNPAESTLFQTVKFFIMSFAPPIFNVIIPAAIEFGIPLLLNRFNNRVTNTTNKIVRRRGKSRKK